MERFSGMQYLMIDVANNFGLDKLKWSERLSWTEENEDKLLSMVKEADKPAMFMASVDALQKARAGFPVHHPIQLDATASGIQMFAALTGCVKSAELSNLVDTGRRMASYKAIYNRMVETLPTEMIASGKPLVLKDDDVKQAIMTSLYASRAEPQKVFGTGPMLAHFYKTMEDMLPGAWELNEAMLGMWDSNALQYDWVMPDNFNVVILVDGMVTEKINFMNQYHEFHRKENIPQTYGRSLGANLAHSVDALVVREMGRRCMFDQSQIISIQKMMDLPESHLGEGDKRQKDNNLLKLMNWYHHSGFMSIRIIDYIDSRNLGILNQKERDHLSSLVQELPRKPFNLMTIHDCFRCLPNYGNDLRFQYNLVMSQITASDMLYFLVSQIKNEKTPVYKMGLDPLQVREANYALS
jgi:hypothetical protein